MLLFLQVALISLLLFIVISIVWDTLKIGISPMPSSRKACRTMLNLLASSGHGTIIDLGAGWGRLAIACACRFPDRRIIGYERSWVPWCISVCLKYALALNNLTVYRQDFIKSDLSGALVLLCYLFPDGMLALKEKLMNEKSEATMLVSNTFALPNVRPDREVKLDDIYRTPIYVYYNVFSR